MLALFIYLFIYFHFLFFHLGSFSYTSSAGFIFMWGVSLKHPVLSSSSSSSSFFFFKVWGVSLTHPMFALFSVGSFSYTSNVGFFFFFFFFKSCWLHFYLRSFSYKCRAGFNVIKGVTLTHPVLVLFLRREFLLHIISLKGVSLTYSKLPSFLCGEFLLHIPCCFHFCAVSLPDTSCAAFVFMRGFSLTHPKLSSFL